MDNVEEFVGLYTYRVRLLLRIRMQDRRLYPDTSIFNDTNPSSHVFPKLALIIIRRYEVEKALSIAESLYRLHWKFNGYLLSSRMFMTQFGETHCSILTEFASLIKLVQLIKTSFKQILNKVR
jgi:hypothetical protein